MIKTKVVIYDCDGVLFDSKKSNEAFYNHILEHFNQPPLQPDQLSFVHVSTAEAAINYLFKSSPRLDEAQQYRKTMDYRPFVPLMRMEPHLREVLARLRPKYHTAIATNRALSMPSVLRVHSLENDFDLTVTAMDVEQPKPHPECLLKILTHFRLSPEEALYIGDALTDLLVSERAGVPFVAYKSPELKARYHLQDHRELLSLLEIRDGET